MTIIVAGGSGFLGQRLVRGWREDGHHVKVLTRRPRGADDVQWAPDGLPHVWPQTLDGADAVVNLAGEGIADQPWTAERKAALLQSRVLSTRVLAAAIRDCAVPPQVFLSASGIGYYGTRGGDASEQSGPGTDFLSALCVAWEREALAAGPVSRVVLLRTGVVLARDGGALPKMAMPFRLFAGGRLGSGHQWISWIHIEDYLEMVRWALSRARWASAHDAVHGPLNLTAPAPVTNAEFTHALARALHRPALLPVPAVVLRTMLGREMADALLLEGRRVVPEKAQQLRFEFRYPSVDDALARIYHATPQGRHDHR